MSFRPIIDSCSAQLTSFSNIKSTTPMQGAAVIPNHKVARLPLVDVYIVALSRMLEQILKKHSAFSRWPAGDLMCMHANVKKLAS